MPLNREERKKRANVGHTGLRAYILDNHTNNSIWFGRAFRLYVQCVFSSHTLPALFICATVYLCACPCGTFLFPSLFGFQLGAHTSNSNGHSYMTQPPSTIIPFHKTNRNTEQRYFYTMNFPYKQCKYSHIVLCISGVFRKGGAFERRSAFLFAFTLPHGPPRAHMYVCIL